MTGYYDHDRGPAAIEKAEANFYRLQEEFERTARNGGLLLCDFLRTCTADQLRELGNVKHKRNPNRHIFLHPRAMIMLRWAKLRKGVK